MTAARRRREQSVPFFRSIQAKYALTYLLVVAAILIVMNTYPILMAENMVFTSKQSNLKRQALVIGSTLAVSETLTREGVEQTMALLEEAQGTRVLVTDATARILYDSSTLDNRLGGYALMGEVAAALRGKDVSRSEYREGAIRSRAAVPILYHGMTLGAVYLYEYDSEQAGVLRSIQANLRYISIVICLVALVLVVLLSKTLTRNTVRLLSAIRHVREGEYSHRVESQGRDEMAQLADEFNQLTGRLQTTEEVRRRFVSDASHELKTPLSSIRLLTDSILQSPSVDMGTVREFVADIGEEADRLTRISEHLLALTRLDAGTEREREPVELGAVAEKVAHLLSPWPGGRRWSSGSAWSPPAPCPPTRTTCTRWPSTWWKTPSNTICPGAGWRWGCPGGGRRWPSPSPTPAWVSPRTTCPRYLNAFTGWTRPAPVRREAPAWGCPSPGIPPGSTAGISLRGRTPPAGAPGLRRSSPRCERGRRCEKRCCQAAVRGAVAGAGLRLRPRRPGGGRGAEALVSHPGAAAHRRAGQLPL